MWLAMASTGQSDGQVMLVPTRWGAWVLAVAVRAGWGGGRRPLPSPFSQRPVRTRAVTRRAAAATTPSTFGPLAGPTRNRRAMPAPRDWQHATSTPRQAI